MSIVKNQEICSCGRGNTYGDITLCHLCIRDDKNPHYKLCNICKTENILYYYNSCYKCICAGCGDKNEPGTHSCAKHKCRIEGCKEAVVKHTITDLCYTHTCKKIACFGVTTTDNCFCCNHENDISKNNLKFKII